MSRTSWSWDKRRRLALAINLVVLCGVTCVAVVSSDSSDWQPLELVFVLGAFAIASDLLSVRIKGIAAADGGSTGWWFTVNAPYVLAVVLLGAAPAVAIAAVSLPDRRNTLANPLAGRCRELRQLRNAPGSSGRCWLLGDRRRRSRGWRCASSAPSCDAIYEFGVIMSFLLNAAYGALAYGEVLRERHSQRMASSARGGVAHRSRHGPDGVHLRNQLAWARSWCSSRSS